MPVNEVVVNDFFPHFFVAVAEKCSHNDVSSRGDAGVRRSVFTIVGALVVVDHTVNVNSSSLMENIVESRSKVLQQ